MERGWVKSYRKIEDWEWYKKPLTAHLFQHLIRRANRTAKKWQGYEIPAGCLVTSIPHLADQTGLTVMQVKTALKHLYSSKSVEKVTDSITDRKKANFTILKVNNYAIYQSDNQPSNRPITDEQPTDNRSITTNKKSRSKEVKNDDFYSSAFPLVGDAIESVRTEFGQSVANAFAFFISHWDAKPPDAAELAEWIDAIRSRPTTVERLEMLEYSSGSNAGGKWYRKLFTDRTVPKKDPEQSRNYDAWAEKMLRLAERKSNEPS